MIRKFAKFELTAASVNPIRNEGRIAQWLAEKNISTQPGFLYVTTRAISSRVNANYDGWPPDQLKLAYGTFSHRPLFVDHNNWDVTRARGVILDTELHGDSKLAGRDDDVWVELLGEVDAQAFPKLGAAILAGDIDSVSMGADVEYTVCSVCDNKAHDVMQYCAHIPQMKGRWIPTGKRTASGNQIKKLCYEDCFFGPNSGFFELSFVFDPADESALHTDVYMPGIVRASSRLVPGQSYGWERAPQNLGLARVATITHEADKVLMTVPPEVDTLRDEMVCPQCFAPGTLVRTREGYVPIEQIKVGEHVLTESGQFNPVLETIQQSFSGNLLGIETLTSVAPIMVTPEHPFRTLIGYHPDKNKQIQRREGYCEKDRCRRHIDQTYASTPRQGASSVRHSIEWTHAHNIAPGHYLGIGLPKASTDSRWISVPKQFLSSRRSGASEFEVNSEFLWIVGMYLAEGSASHREISFGLHKNEIEFQERIQKFFATHDYSTAIHHRGENGVAVEVYGTILSEWLPVWLGRGSHNKAIPAELINLPASQLTHLLQGILDGDGHEKRDALGQTSPILALQVSEISMRLGGLPATSVEKPLGRKPVYRQRLLTARVDNGSRAGMWRVNGTVLARVKTVKEIPYSGLVFNLHVANDPTYVVQNLIAHNCGATDFNGMCEVCGFELPPEGLRDPNTEPDGTQMPAGPQEGSEGPTEEGPEGQEDADQQQGTDQQAPENQGDNSGGDQGQDEDSGKKAPPKKAPSKKDKGSSEKTSPKNDEKDDSKSNKGEKSNKSDSSSKDSDKSPKQKAKDRKSDSDSDSGGSDVSGIDEAEKAIDDGDTDKAKKLLEKLKKQLKGKGKTGGTVSRYAEMLKRSTLPQDPPYRQDAAPANSVPPYGQALPGGTPTDPAEPALMPAPAAVTNVQDLDAPDLVGPPGQSAVSVPGQAMAAKADDDDKPAFLKKKDDDDDDSKDSDDDDSDDDDDDDDDDDKDDSKSKKKSSLQTQAAQLRAQAEVLEKQAENVMRTDVENLDAPSGVNVSPDATVDVLAPVQEADQLARADTPDSINDGSETGLSIQPEERAQPSPFNDAAFQPYSPPNPQVPTLQRNPVASVDERAAQLRDIAERRMSTQKARDDQRLAAAKTRVLRIYSFIEDRIALGLTDTNEKFKEVARFEEMPDEKLDGYIDATREFKSNRVRTAGQRVRVQAGREVPTMDRVPNRMPALGGASRLSDESSIEAETGFDYLTFLPSIRP